MMSGEPCGQATKEFLFQYCDQEMFKKARTSFSDASAATTER